MIPTIMGIEYGRGACATPRDDGPALAPAAIKRMFPNANWISVTPDTFNPAECAADRFAENTRIQRKIYDATPTARHILVGGDHSVNFGHFSAIADQLQDDDLCLVYIDAHMDMHTPESSRTQASGAPHGTNVRALMGHGDARWLALQRRQPALRAENLFYLATRSFEPAEKTFTDEHNIFIRTAAQLAAPGAPERAVAEIMHRIGSRPYVVSLDFDAIDPQYFGDVWVPEHGGISVETARKLIRALAPRAHSVEFVEYSPTGDTQSAQIAHDLIDIALNY